MRPSYWSGILIVEADVAHQLSGQVGDGGEDASGNDVALDFGEDQLDLVEPGGVGRDEMDPDVGVGLKEAINELGLVGGEVVGDHVDLAAARLLSNQHLEELDELFATVPSCRLADD